MAGGGNTVDLDILGLTGSDKIKFTLATPPLAGGADLSGYRYVVHPVASFHLDARMLHQQKASPHCVSAEATGMPERRTQCGDERTRGHSMPPADRLHDLRQLLSEITSLPADRQQTFSTV